MNVCLCPFAPDSKLVDACFVDIFCAISVKGLRSDDFLLTYFV